MTIALQLCSCGSAQTHINRPNESVAWHACVIKYVSREHAWTLCSFPVARGVNVCQNMHMYSCLSAVVNVELYCPVVLFRHRGSGKQWRSICARVLVIARMIQQRFHIWITDHAGEWTDKYSLSLWGCIHLNQALSTACRLWILKDNLTQSPV